MTARAEAKFYGTVQGVSFRDYTRRYAIAGRVHGWVQNLPDGSVSAVFEGDRKDIEAVVHRLCTEHPLAKVERFELRGPSPSASSTRSPSAASRRC